MIDLSQRQSDVLDFVVQAIESRGLPPSYREIGDALGIASTNGVSDHVKALIKKGYLKKLEGGSGKARGLQLTAKSRSMHASDNLIEIPLVGHVAAGSPILAEEHHESVVHFDANLLRGDGPTVALRVRGDSMIEEGIHDGDMVLVRQQATARNGDIVVVARRGRSHRQVLLPRGSPYPAPAGEQQHGPHLRGAGPRDAHPRNGGRSCPRLLSGDER